MKKDQRIYEHPILGKADFGNKVEIEYNGKKLWAYSGEPIAAALLANGVKVFRYTSKYNQPRTIFCGIGRCTDCMMIVDGQPNVRTCITKVREGMKVETQYGKYRNCDNRFGSSGTSRGD